MTALDLTTEEKIAIIDSHIRNILHNKFNAELTIIEQNALETPYENAITNATAQIAQAELQITALQAQRTALEV